MGGTSKQATENGDRRERIQSKLKKSMGDFASKAAAEVITDEITVLGRAQDRKLAAHNTGVNSRISTVIKEATTLNVPEEELDQARQPRAGKPGEETSEEPGPLVEISGSEAVEFLLLKTRMQARKLVEFEGQISQLGSNQDTDGVKEMLSGKVPELVEQDGELKVEMRKKGPEEFLQAVMDSLNSMVATVCSLSSELLRMKEAQDTGHKTLDTEPEAPKPAAAEAEPQVAEPDAVEQPVEPVAAEAEEEAVPSTDIVDGEAAEPEVETEAVADAEVVAEPAEVAEAEQEAAVEAEPVEQEEEAPAADESQEQLEAEVKALTDDSKQLFQRTSEDDVYDDDLRADFRELGEGLDPDSNAPLENRVSSLEDAFEGYFSNLGLDVKFDRGAPLQERVEELQNALDSTSTEGDQ